MSLYVDEAVALHVSAKNPFTKALMTDLDVVADIWHVETHGNPKTDATKRDVPGWGPIVLEYDEDAEGYVGYFQPDDNRLPGRYVFRARMTGLAFDNYEFGAFSLKP